MASKKLTWLLILQGWTMLWVVIGHAPLSEPMSNSSFDLFMHQTARILFDFAYSFHMPLFIMISGYLFYSTRIAKGWRYLDMIKEKFLRLGIPYMVFITIAIVIKICLPGNVDRAVDVSPGGFVMNYVSPFTGALQEMWFIAVIILYFLAYPIYSLLLKNIWTISIVLLCAVGMYFIPVGKMIDIFAINRAVHFFIYFFIGMVINSRKLDKYISSWVSIILFAIVYAVSFWGKLGILVSLSVSLSFWGLAVKADKGLSDNIFHTFRKYTYQIFLIGIFAQILVKALYGRFFVSGSYFIWWLVCVLVGIYVPVIIAKIAEKTNNGFIRKSMGL